jgi:SRSO17 transposase
VREYVFGLVAGVERKNGWTVAAHAGEVAPDGVQWLLRWVDWDVDGVRDRVIERLGDAGGVLVVDDTRFVKKGIRSAGVQRQCFGTAGRIEDCQIGVFLVYASQAGHALIDRELYLPESWTSDRPRVPGCGYLRRGRVRDEAAAGKAMLARAFDAGVPCSWVTADEAYG